MITPPLFTALEGRRTADGVRPIDRWGCAARGDREIGPDRCDTDGRATDPRVTEGLVTDGRDLVERETEEGRRTALELRCETPLDARAGEACRRPLAEFRKEPERAELERDGRLKLLRSRETPRLDSPFDARGADGRDRETDRLAVNCRAEEPPRLRDARLADRAPEDRPTDRLADDRAVDRLAAEAPRDRLDPRFR